MPVKEPEDILRELFGEAGVTQFPSRYDPELDAIVPTNPSDRWNPVKEEMRETLQDMWDRLAAAEAAAVLHDVVYPDRFTVNADPGTTNMRPATSTADGLAASDDLTLITRGLTYHGGTPDLTAKKAILAGETVGFSYRYRDQSGFTVKLDLTCNVQSLTALTVDGASTDFDITGTVRFAGRGVSVKPGLDSTSDLSKGGRIHDLTLIGTHENAKTGVLLDGNISGVQATNIHGENILRAGDSRDAFVVAVSGRAGTDADVFLPSKNVSVRGVSGRNIDGSVVHVEDHLVNFILSDVQADETVTKSAVEWINDAAPTGGTLRDFRKSGGGQTLALIGLAWAEDMGIYDMAYVDDGAGETDPAIVIGGVASKGLRMIGGNIDGHGGNAVQINAASGIIDGYTFKNVAGAAITGRSTKNATGIVQGIALRFNGRGYASAPTVTITGGGGSGATATCTIDGNGFVDTITVTNGGSGYTSRPTVTFSGGSPTTPAEAIAAVSKASSFIIGDGNRFENVGSIIDTANAAYFRGGNEARGNKQMAATTAETVVLFVAKRAGYITHCATHLTGTAGPGGAVSAQVAFGKNGGSQFGTVAVQRGGAAWSINEAGFGGIGLASNTFAAGDVITASCDGLASLNVPFGVFISFFYYD